jgi:hypothetical protein
MTSHRRPDPGQILFRWVWSDPADDRPDAPADDLDSDDLVVAPLRNRVDALERPRPGAYDFQRPPR